MKTRSLLALLLCFLLVQSQTYAISGGPNYAVTSLTGTYAGVLLVDTTSGTAPANALGVFSFQLPEAGVGSGQFLMFSDGIIYNVGTITAVGNPEKKEIQGILSATYDYSITSTVTAADGTLSSVTTPVTLQANGQMQADVDSSTSFGQNFVRLDGTAILTMLGATADPVTGLPVATGTLTFLVSGYRQSTTVATTSITAAASTTGG